MELAFEEIDSSAADLQLLTPSVLHHGQRLERDSGTEGLCSSEEESGLQCPEENGTQAETEVARQV